MTSITSRDLVSAAKTSCQKDIYPSGDLQIVVTLSHGQISWSDTWTVSSEAMSMASHVWRAFINPPFEQIQNPENNNAGGQIKKLDFSEDIGEALRILLEIAHLQFTKIPAEVGFQLLYDIAILCDKYDCVGLVQPWLPSWLPSWTIADHWEKCEPVEEGWLMILWVFGLESQFRQVARQLARYVKLDDSGGYLNPSGCQFPDQLPPGSLEEVFRIRLETITKLLRIPYQYLERFDAAEAICTDFDTGRKCDALVHGSLIRQLKNVKLWPPAKPNEILSSVDDVKNDINWIQIEQYPSLSTHSSDTDKVGERFDHSQCCLREMSFKVWSVLESMPGPALDSHVLHMEKQEAKLARS